MKNKDYVVAFKGKEVSIFFQDGSLLRRFKAKAEIVTAQITKSNTNPVVALTTKDGKFELYRTDGTLIRRS